MGLLKRKLNYVLLVSLFIWFSHHSFQIGFFFSSLSFINYDSIQFNWTVLTKNVRWVQPNEKYRWEISWKQEWKIYLFVCFLWYSIKLPALNRKQRKQSLIKCENKSESTSKNNKRHRTDLYRNRHIEAVRFSMTDFIVVTCVTCFGLCASLPQQWIICPLNAWAGIVHLSWTLIWSNEPFELITARSMLHLHFILLWSK